MPGEFSSAHSHHPVLLPSWKEVISKILPTETYLRSEEGLGYGQITRAGWPYLQGILGSLWGPGEAQAWLPRTLTLGCCLDPGPGFVSSQLVKHVGLQCFCSTLMWSVPSELTPLDTRTGLHPHALPSSLAAGAMPPRGSLAGQEKQLSCEALLHARMVPQRMLGMQQTPVALSLCELTHPQDTWGCPMPATQPRSHEWTHFVGHPQRPGGFPCVHTLCPVLEWSRDQPFSSSGRTTYTATSEPPP